MPDYFYKYQSIKNTDDLISDHAIDALFNNYAIFSNRKNFNDLFDSKINLIKPTPKQIKAFKNNLSDEDAQYFSTLVSKGKLTPAWSDFVEKMVMTFNTTIDNYIFYCVSINPANNLMWSHYAGSHYGFCIEFKAKLLQASKVTYQKNIPSIDMLDLIKLTFKVKEDNGLDKKIWSALRTKLDEWEYEGEYRFQASNQMQKDAIEVKDKYTKIEYSPECIKSIIFGCRMNIKIREFIIDNMPDFIKYKEVIVKNNGIKVIDYKPKRNI